LLYPFFCAALELQLLMRAIAAVARSNIFRFWCYFAEEVWAITFANAMVQASDGETKATRSSCP
jgi:hypothetical protein